MNTYLKYKPVWVRIISLSGLMLAGQIVLAMISFAIAAKFSGFTLEQMLQPDYNNPQMLNLQKWLLPLVSGLGGYLIPALLYAYFADPHPRSFLRADVKPATHYWIIAVAIVVIAIPSAFWVGQLNKHLDLSHIFPAFDKWMKEAEAHTNNIIEKMIGKQRFSDVIINLFLFAAVPAISEEFFFRGLIQKGIIRATRNVWAGIILSAFIFSAFHFQFLTFLTRFEMGIILGVLFWYSGSIWVPILAHFVFNGLQIVVSYWKPNMADPPPGIISAEVVGISFLAVLALILIARKTSTVSMSEVFDDEDDNLIIEPKDLNSGT